MGNDEPTIKKAGSAKMGNETTGKAEEGGDTSSNHSSLSESIRSHFG